MKRCSQCEFTFDDKQHFCDFDGTELVSVAPPTVTRASRTQRLVHSPLPLALVMIAAVLSSALLIGYYESTEQPSLELSSKTDTRSSVSPLIAPLKLDTSDQAKTPPDKPTTITTQRRISTRDAAMPASMIRWPSELSHSRSRSQRGPSNSQLVATNPKHRKSNNSWEAGNRKRVTTPQLVQQRQSIAHTTNGTSSAESMHHAKGSKLVAFFRTTGRLLKRPFGF